MTVPPIAEQLFDMPPAWRSRDLYRSGAGVATYGDTRDAMLRIAAWLTVGHGLEPAARVALCLPRGLPAAQIILGVLAAGAIYLPLQHNGPPERLDAMLASFEPDLIITTDAMAGRLGRDQPGKNRFRTITLDPDLGQFSRRIAALAPLGRPVRTDPEAAAAVFFTSGSTGEPKGVTMSSASLATTAAMLARNLPLRADDRLIVLPPLQYSASIALFYPLFAGCETYLLSEEEVMFPEVVAKVLERERTTVWLSAATLLRLLVEQGGLASRDLGALRSVDFFGERLPIATLRAAMARVPNARFQHTYGASEAFWMMSYEVPNPLPVGLEALPLGSACPGYEISLLADDGKEVPRGEVGEICAIGPVALMGYWNRPDLTAAARLEGIPNSYRTGDLAMLGPDGNYHFVGRRDHQVKVRGHRLELGEIESVLKSHAAVRDAVAFVVRGDQGGEAVACCVRAEVPNRLTEELLSICARRLPTFARPIRIVVLPGFPQLASGKVDRVALQKTYGGR